MAQNFGWKKAPKSYTMSREHAEKLASRTNEQALWLQGNRFFHLGRNDPISVSVKAVSVKAVKSKELWDAKTALRETGYAAAKRSQYLSRMNSPIEA